MAFTTCVFFPTWNRSHNKNTNWLSFYKTSHDIQITDFFSTKYVSWHEKILTFFTSLTSACQPPPPVKCAKRHPTLTFTPQITSHDIQINWLAFFFIKYVTRPRKRFRKRFLSQKCIARIYMKNIWTIYIYIYKDTEKIGLPSRK